MNDPFEEQKPPTPVPGKAKPDPTNLIQMLKTRKKKPKTPRY